MEIKRLAVAANAAILALLTVVACTSEQPGAPVVTIDAGKLEAHVQTLASNEFEGRGAGYRGEKMAANYIAESFANIGLAPSGDVKASNKSYFQSFKFSPSEPATPWETRESQNVVAVLPGPIQLDIIVTKIA